MKKPTKKLRKLLAWYKGELLKKPYTPENSNTVELIDTFIERIGNAIYH